jgi:transposase
LYASKPISPSSVTLAEGWERIRDHFLEENIGDGRPGRKPTPTRCVFEAVLWILNTGAQWHMTILR